MWNTRRKSGISPITMMAIALIIVGTNAGRPSRIRGGSDASLGESKFVVRLTLHARVGLDMSCTGAIIGRRHVLTAAHCIDGRISGKVYGGNIRRSDPNIIVRNIVNFHKHPGYTTLLSNDIAVVEVDRDFELHGRQALASLSPSRLQFNNRGTLFGWSSCGSDNQVALQKLVVSSMTQEACNSDLDLYPRYYCVDSSFGNSCSGDSGGPIVSNGRIVGVHLGRIGEGRPGYAANVDHYRSFINKYVGR